MDNQLLLQESQLRLQYHVNLETHNVLFWFVNVNPDVSEHDNSISVSYDVFVRNLVRILRSEIAVTTEISYLFSITLPAARLYADRYSLLFKSFKIHVFPSFPPSFKVRSASDFFRTPCQSSPCLGL